ADAARPDEWWDGKPFDRILVDAPCSALGVVSKHPDIKHHRKPADIDRVVEQQRHLLEGLLPLLNRNGKLLYTTCSILARENDDQIEAVLRNHPNFSIDQLPPSLGHQTRFGRQRLQDNAGGDGFYYARLKNQ
ncbi:MAG: 16S rRNA (cytosine(967)-C(5))-methyltransferase, partial [Gammaproteobacteria bacterium]|nr:16S rRNA (cytosine(967)-C(5))-methyltransferase [Gammaproteobacteria bacterium]